MTYDFTADGKRADAVIVHLDVDDDHYEFVVVDMQSTSGPRKFGQGQVLVTSLQADKAAAYHRLGGGHWSDFEGIIGPNRGAAEQVWQWFQQFKTFNELKEPFR